MSEKGYFEGVGAATILVPLIGAPSDIEVIRQAALTTRRCKGLLYAVHVIVVKQQLALETSLPDQVTHAEEVLKNALTIGHEYGVKVETSILQARSAGVAIVEEAVEREVKMIVMGITYRSRLGEFYMGKTVPYVLKNSPCEVWIYRERLTDKDHDHAADE